MVTITALVSFPKPQSRRMFVLCLNSNLRPIPQLYSISLIFCRFNWSKLEKKDAQSNIENLESICKDSEIDSRLKEIIINFKNGIDFDNETIKILIDRIEVFEDRTINIIYKI